MVGLIITIVLVGGAAAIIFSLRAGNPVVALVVIVAVVVAAVWISRLIVAAITPGAVRLSETGIITSGPLMQRTIGWDQITAVLVMRTRSGRFGCVRLRDGSLRRIALLRDGPPRRDPEFDAKMQRIAKYWKTYRGSVD